ncbi:hypothetical protein [Burkholderia gladioli]|uniref:hypothetical protein n=1 Tax=Burkholderia gladioli TaxID=28095 RepID=UPI0022D35C46|nr:hypothetical protein [Burkholderia gladioli]MDA0569849.1 hypothetical protein [Burkholderia gladioli]MDA0598331.1 hypothetical protein [Burkholderia gladioli]
MAVSPAAMACRRASSSRAGLGIARHAQFVAEPALEIAATRAQAVLVAAQRLGGFAVQAAQRERQRAHLHEVERERVDQQGAVGPGQQFVLAPLGDQALADLAQEGRDGRRRRLGERHAERFGG